MPEPASEPVSEPPVEAEPQAEGSAPPEERAEAEPPPVSEPCALSAPFLVASSPRRPSTLRLSRVEGGALIGWMTGQREVHLRALTERSPGRWEPEGEELLQAHRPAQELVGLVPFRGAHLAITWGRGGGRHGTFVARRYDAQGAPVGEPLAFRSGEMTAPRAAQEVRVASLGEDRILAQIDHNGDGAHAFRIGVDEAGALTMRASPFAGTGVVKAGTALDLRLPVDAEGAFGLLLSTYDEDSSHRSGRDVWWMRPGAPTQLLRPDHVRMPSLTEIEGRVRGAAFDGDALLVVTEGEEEARSLLRFSREGQLLGRAPLEEAGALPLALRALELRLSFRGPQMRLCWVRPAGPAACASWGPISHLSMDLGGLGGGAPALQRPDPMDAARLDASSALAAWVEREGPRWRLMSRLVRCAGSEP